MSRYDTERVLPAGTMVTLTNDMYQTCEQGELLHEVQNGSYTVVTIKLADGSRYRTEGRVWAYEVPNV